MLTTVLTFVCINLFGQTGYIENRGQWNREILFKTDQPGAVFYLKKNGISILQYDEKAWSEVVQHASHEHKIFKSSRSQKVGYHHFELDIVGKNLDCLPHGVNAKAHHYNYFIGNDPNLHASNVSEFEEIVYTDIYPNIDLVIHSGGSGLKYDFVLQPNASIEDIKLRYNHVESVTLKGDSVAIKTSIGTVYEHIPLAYIMVDGVRKPVQCSYTLQNGILGYISESKSDFPLTIDPEVVFATYAGNSVDNFGFTATYDASGHLYAGGISTGPDLTFNPNGRYPATLGAFDVTYNQGQVLDEYFFPCDVTLSKYAPDGSTLIFATYLGGESNEYPHSIVVDKNDQLIAFGTTFSMAFPTSTNAFQRFNRGESDLFITKFTADGSTLIGSTMVGGSQKDGLNEESTLNFFYADNFRGEVIVDSNNSIYVASCSRSNDFPTNNAFQNQLNGNQDGLILKMNSDLSQMISGSYLGGSSGDAVYSVDLDTSGIIYVSGGTKSTNFPGTKGAIGNSYKGGVADGFIAMINPDNFNLIKTAFWGGNNYDQIFSLEIDFENKIYVVGQSISDMPVIGQVYNNPKSGQFITKFDDQLEKVEFSTVFGTGKSTPDITINAFLVDECRKIFISGWGGKTSDKSYSSTHRLPITRDAYQDTTDGSDFYLMVLSKGAKELLYGTFFGGNMTNDHVDGGTSRFDKKGVIYQSVCASCPADAKAGHAISDFPTTKGAYAEKNVSPRCSNASFKIAFGNLNRPPQLSDVLHRVTALDTLSFDYLITDPDADSLFVELTPDPRLKDKFVQFNPKSKSLETWSQRISLIGGCDNVGDTLTIAVYSADKGCPASKDSFATIRIVVDPPPVLAPPENICLKFVDDDKLMITWNSIPKSKYFLKTSLYRKDPDGLVMLLATFNDPNSITHLDKNLIKPKTRNYSYYVVVTNLCGVDGPESYHVSSTKEFSSPIPATYIITATVNNQNEVEVYWESSDEQDFATYDLYRKKNSDKETYEYLGSTYNRIDTMFTDKNVRVNEQSYCYVIVVNDNCGHVSEYSNSGCTIVLEGISKPFEHNVYWNEYTTWQDGVHEYILSRSVDTGNLRPVVTTSFDWRTYKDTTWDYNWGGYWYRVTGYENGGSHNAQSQSNKIYLIQPPLLHVPNAFTPNGDDLNELWGIVPVFVKEYHVQVFDRWGERVYDSEDVKLDWDGFYKRLQTGNTVYMYVIRFTGWDRSIHHRQGTVTILK